MNANELADALEDWDNDGQWDEVAANMLRQQANRIEVLEANHKLQLNINDKAIKYIIELEKALSAQQMTYDPKKHGAEE